MEMWFILLVGLVCQGLATQVNYQTSASAQSSSSAASSSQQQWSWQGDQTGSASDQQNSFQPSSFSAPDTVPQMAQQVEQEQHEVYELGASGSDQTSDSLSEQSVESVIDDILVSNRQGRNLDGFDEVYADPNVKNALQLGNDTIARTYIRDKLCSLGLMNCDNTEGRRPFYSPHHDIQPQEIIYAQPVTIKPVGRPLPAIPVKRPYGPPRPVPFPPAFGARPPGPIYSRPPHSGPSHAPHPPFSGPPPSFSGPPPSFSGPPPSFNGPYAGYKKPGYIHGSKPVYEVGIDGEVEYEDKYINKKQMIVGQGSGVQQHVHHHYVHGDEVGNKEPIILGGTTGALANNGYGYGSGGDFEDYKKAFNTKKPSSGNNLLGAATDNYANRYPVYEKPKQTSFFNGEKQLETGKQLNAGFGSNNNFASSNGFNSNGLTSNGFGSSGLGSNGFGSNGVGPNGLGLNGLGPNGLGPNGLGPNGLGPNGLGPNGLGPNGLGPNGLGPNGLGSNGFGPNGLGSNGFGSSNNNFGSSNNNFGSNSNNFGSNSNNFGSNSNNFGSNNNNFGSSNGFENGLGSNSYDDCVCVPYDQCTTLNQAGRKDDLYLAIDPRNLGKDIEAETAVVTDGNNTMSVVRITKEVDNSEQSEKTKDLKDETTEEEKERTKRDVKHLEAKDKKQEAESRQFGRPPVCGPSHVCCRKANIIGRPARPGQCGTRNGQGINGRIKNPVYVDGDSEFGEYPWQVAILKKDPSESVYVCGGTLISPRHVLTAAHCVKTHAGRDLRARLGEWDVNHDVEFFPYIERDVVSVYVHPEFYAGTLYNDLAILKLDQDVNFEKNPHISPACLPQKFEDFTGTRCWTTGWGKDAFGDFGKYQNILKEVDVPVVSNPVCEQQMRRTRLGQSFNLHPGFICAGGEEGKDACKGDGGGPMVCERQGKWQLAGVVSWGIGCGKAGVPGVYARVSYYLDWINQVVDQF